jgi:hypothetical protein
MFVRNVNGRITARKAKEARRVTLANRGVIRVDFDGSHDFYFNNTHNKRLLEYFGVLFVRDSEKGS